MVGSGDSAVKTYYLYDGGSLVCGLSCQPGMANESITNFIRLLDNPGYRIVWDAHTDLMKIGQAPLSRHVCLTASAIHTVLQFLDHPRPTAPIFILHSCRVKQCQIDM
jgi:hypothetical protein